ncbi:MAG: hypothetical protein MUC48_19620 [Leptolyngbya sp. Prado105]|jgi:hypothetical protein|nr:hypothetical protein [Leptolyngbya sp. Prado105]
MLKTQFIAGLIAFTPLLASSAFARQPDHGCYMRTSSGQVINLSSSICKFDLDEKFAKQDIAYLAAIKQMMGSHSDRWMTDALAKNPSLFTAAAREYCQARQSGVSDQQYMEEKYQAVMDSRSANPPQSREEHEQQQAYQAQLVPVSIAMSLAPQHYCPEVANR